MKKFLLFLGGAIALVLLLSNIGPMIFLGISLLVAYYATRKFILADTMTVKILWGILVLIGLGMSLTNIPAFVGVAAFVLLYYVYKNWKKEKTSSYKDDDLSHINW